ncbi:MAG: phage tail protein [Erythrobacter sp.]|nr:phage tail protein [Erythrobacter sp.]
MQKPASLRKALHAALPSIRSTPDRLAIWIEDGAVRVRQTESHSFAFHYPLSILLREEKTDIAIVVHAINRWLRANQPDLLAGGAGDSYKFETDILDNGTADILFTIDLTESVSVARNPDESWAIDYLPEPDPMFASDAPVEGLDGTTPLAGVDAIVADGG